MLKHLFFITILSASCLCLKAQAPEYSDEEIIKIYTQLGDVHNKGLEVVFGNLQKNYGSVYSGNNSKEAYTKFNQQIDEFLRSFIIEELSVKEIDLTEFIESSHTSPLSKSENVDLVDLISNKEDGKTLSEDFYYSMKELNLLIENGKLAPSKEDYDKLITNYISRLKTFKEKIYLVSCISIGYSSQIYWSKHLSKWQEFFGTEVIGNNSDPTMGKAKDIVKADISGIIVGGVGGCISGAVGGTITFPVVGTIAGCAGVGAVGAVTGGLGGSLTSAVNSLLSWLLD